MKFSQGLYEGTWIGFENLGKYKTPCGALKGEVRRPLVMEGTLVGKATW